MFFSQVDFLRARKFWFADSFFSSYILQASQNLKYLNVILQPTDLSNIICSITAERKKNETLFLHSPKQHTWQPVRTALIIKEINASIYQRFIFRTQWRNWCPISVMQVQIEERKKTPLTNELQSKHCKKPLFVWCITFHNIYWTAFTAI